MVNYECQDTREGISSSHRIFVEGAYDEVLQQHNSSFYNLDLLTLQRCHRHRNALSKRNRFRSFCYEKCCSKPFQSLETPLFFATSMAISHVPLTFFLFKEIDHLDLSILALRKIHNQVVVYLHKDVIFIIRAVRIIKRQQMCLWIQSTVCVKYPIFAAAMDVYIFSLLGRTIGCPPRGIV